MPRVDGKAPDGKAGVNEQFVDAEGRAGTRALSETDQQHAVEEGTAYIFYSTYSATGGEEVWYLKNDGRDIHVDRIEVSTSVSGIFTVLRQTGGTAVGTLMEGRNEKLGVAILDDVTAFGSASVTGSVVGDNLVAHDLPTTVPFIFNLDGLIIPKGQALVVRAATTGVVHVAGFVHVEE